MSDVCSAGGLLEFLASSPPQTVWVKAVRCVLRGAVQSLCDKKLMIIVVTTQYIGDYNHLIEGFRTKPVVFQDGVEWTPSAGLMPQL